MPDVKLKGEHRELYSKCNFIVQVENGWSAGFQKCSELSFEIQKMEYFEGASAIPWKAPSGHTTFADVTLERGVSTSRKFFEWAIAAADAALFAANGVAGGTRGAGLTVPNFMKNLTIIQLDLDKLISNAVRIWQVYNAWPVKFVAGDWDSTANEPTIESITLAYDYFDIQR
jgi:phage tail-like protein